MKCTKWVSAALAALTLLTVDGRLAQAETFSYSGLIGAGQTWEAAGNWTADNAAPDTTDVYPGQVALTNNATLVSDHGGAALGVDISTPITVTTLELGDTNVAPGATSVGGAGTLTATNINSMGNAGAVNSINVGLLTQGVTFGGNGNGLAVNGSVVINAGGARNLINNVAQTLTYNGPISLSNGTAAGNVHFRNNVDAGVTVFNAAISNGAVAPASAATVQVRYARGTFHNKVDNTYTGATQIGDNAPNNASTNIIYTDGVFSTGRVVFGGGAAIKTVAGAAGFGTRTIANEVQLSRDARFAGPESIVLTGQMFQSNTRSIINDIDTGKTLSLNGAVYTDSGTNAVDLGRFLTFNGSGLTIVNGTIDDKLGNAAANLGRTRQSGTGRTIFANSGVVQYANATEVTGGTLQLGTGGAAVGLNAHSVQGIANTTGVLEINHSGSLSFDAALGYNVLLNHVGTGTTTMTSSSFGTGQIDVQAGKVLINGGLFAGLNYANQFRDGTNPALIAVPSTAGIRLGQPVTLTAGTGTTATPPANVYVVDILTATNQVLLSANLPSSGFNAWNLAFGAGTGTGSANVLASGGTVGGTGIIGGSLTVAANGHVAPGASIGTLAVSGDATVNGSFDVEYDGAAGGSIDLLNVTGSLVLGPGSVLNLSNIGSPADDPVYVLANYGGIRSGTFGAISGMPSGYNLFYGYNGGHSLALVQVPEPASIILVGLGCAALVARRRR